MEFLELKKELKQAVEQAEEYAIASLQSSNDFFPYIFSGDKKIKKIIEDTIDDAIEIAHEEIEDMEEETVIFVYKEAIELADGKFDAIVTQVFNDDEDHGYSFALIYRIINNKISFLNQRVSLGNIRNVLIF